MPIHVTPKDGKWQVKKGGASKASRVVDTKAEAEAIAREQARNQGASVRFHKKDGTVQSNPNVTGNGGKPRKATAAKKTTTKKTATKKTTAKKTTAKKTTTKKTAKKPAKRRGEQYVI